MTPLAFRRYLGIHYSGAETPDSGLKTLRVYSARPDTPPHRVLPPPGPRRYWSRRELAHWLAEQLAGDTPTIVGIDHALSFPLRYFEVHRLAPDWMVFLEDFHRHWPTDAPHIYVDFILNGARGQGAERMGSPRWMRLTDERCKAARSVFQFEGQGKFAAATHAGLPWTLYLKRQLGERLHVWPFDGWSIAFSENSSCGSPSDTRADGTGCQADEPDHFTRPVAICPHPSIRPRTTAFGQVFRGRGRPYLTVIARLARRPGAGDCA